MSCVVCPNAKNKFTGALNPSKFFKGLLGYHQGDRQKTKEDYVTGTSDDFKERFGDKVKWDSNEEPTVDSYLEFSNREVDKSRRIAALNKQLESGEYDFDTALAKKNNFEKLNDDDVNSRFEVLMTPVEGHKFKIQVVEISPEVTIKNIEAIKNKTLYDRILEAVRDLGADITYTQEKYSSYSTENVEKMANGYAALIKLANNENVDVTSDAAHEAGHLAIGALGENNILVQRLKNSLTDDVIAELMPDEKDIIANSKNSSREAMGSLVGKYILNEVDKKSKVSRLLSRIVNSTKKMFYTLTMNKLQKMKLEAQSVAEDIAYNFMTQTNNGSLENALDIEETLYSKIYKDTTDLCKEMYVELAALSKRLGAFSSRSQKELEQALGIANKGATAINEDENIFVDNAAKTVSKDAVLSMLKIVHDLLNTEDIRTKLANLSHSPAKIAESAVTLNEIDSIIDSADAIIKMLNIIIGDTTRSSGEKVYDIDQDTTNILSSFLGRNKSDGFINIIDGFKAAVANERRVLFLKFIQNIYGKDYIVRSAKLVFKNGRLQRTFNEDAGVAERQVALSKYLDNMEADNDYARRVLSLSNSKDVISQIIAFAEKQYDEKSNLKTLDTWVNKLIPLREYCKKHNVNTEELFEYAEDPETHKMVKTGNFISEVNWGKWEFALKQEIKKIKEDWDNSECKNRLGKNPSQLPKIVRQVGYAKYRKERLKQWHSENSFRNKANIFEPIGWQQGQESHKNYGRYVNHTYYDKFNPNIFSGTITQEELEAAKHRKYVLDEFIKIKTEETVKLKEFNPTKGREFAHQAYPMRMPQFREKSIEGIKKSFREDGIKAKSKTFAKKFANAITKNFVAHATDSEYGSNNPLNNIEEDKEIAAKTSNLKKITTYGVRKLDDMSELTTDLFYGMLQYSNMANHYQAFYNLAAILECGRRELAIRDQKATMDSKRGNGSLNRPNSSSKVFEDFSDFMDTIVYGESNLGKFIGNVDLTKTMGFIGSIATKWLLAGNVPGATVNTVSGQIELFKEAFAGSELDGKTLAKAEWEYLKYLVPNIYHSGNQFKTDKLALFTKEFDIGGRLTEGFHSYNTNMDNKKGKILNALPFLGNNNSMWLYSSSDHYLQSIPYIAYAIATKVRLNDGSEINLWDALVTETVEENGVKTTRLVFNPLLKNQFEVDRKGHHSIRIPELDEDGNIRGYSSPMSYEDKGYFKIKNRCVEFTNRVYGIYNKHDKKKFQLKWWGKLISSMKGYVFGRIAKDFTDSGYNIALDKEGEGSFDTFLKVLYMGTVNDVIEKEGIHKFEQISTTLKLTLACALPFTSAPKKYFKSLGFDTEQYRNMKRIWMGTLMSMLLMMLEQLTIGWLYPEEDEEDEKYKGEDWEEKTKGVSDKVKEKLLEERKRNFKEDKEKAYNKIAKALGKGYSKLEKLYIASKIPEFEKYEFNKDFAEAYNKKKEYDAFTKTKVKELIVDIKNGTITASEAKDQLEKAQKQFNKDWAAKKKEKKAKPELTEIQKIAGFYGAYVSHRAAGEQTGYLPYFVKDIKNEAKSVLNLLPASTAVFIDLAQLYEVMEYEKEYREVVVPEIRDEERKERELKVKKGGWENELKSTKEISRHVPYLRSLGVLNDPKHAIQSYDYIRNRP